MKIANRFLLSALAGVATFTTAQAADLPVRKAAPVEYVRVCDAYGAGFFYIPETDTCLKVGGLVLAQMGFLPSTQLYSMALPVGTPIAALNATVFPGVAGAVPAPGAYRSVFARETLGYLATARVELDARTQSPFGTVRTFVRVSAGYGSGSSYSTGSLASSLGSNAFNVTAGPTISRELLFLDKGFIQFAGITAGRTQSFFDFYADAINYAGLKGSNSTVWAAGYTFNVGGGFSITGAIEDAASRRGPVASVVNTANVFGINGATIAGGAPVANSAAAIAAFGGGGVSAATAAARLPNLVANVRWDQPWGAVQFSGAVNQVRANLFPNAALFAGAPTFSATNGTGSGGTPTAYAQSVNSTSSLGFALLGGVQFNLDMVAPGDKLWLQGIFTRGAIGYVQGSNLIFLSGPSSTANYGIGGGRTNNGVGWTNFADVDCVFTYSGSCDKSTAFVAIAAFKHFWTPTISSGFFGSYMEARYSQAAQTPINPYNLLAQGRVGPANANVGPLFTGGVPNYRDLRVGTNLVWTPVRNFDIGAEITWARYMTDRPFGLAPDLVLQSIGLPKFSGVNNQYLGAIRMIRAF